MLETSFATTR